MTDPYAHVKAHFEKVAGVTVNAGRGAQGLKVGKKMFAMFSAIVSSRRTRGIRTPIPT